MVQTLQAENMTLRELIDLYGLQFVESLQDCLRFQNPNSKLGIQGFEVP